MPSTGPICTAINEQFDAWDAQIDELKNKSAEAAREQAEKIKKDIKDYVEEKKEELTEQKEETNAKKKAFAVPDVPSKPEDILGWATKVKDILTEIVNVITSVALDITLAPGLLVNRANQSLQKLGTPPNEQFEPIPEPEPEPEPDSGS